MRFTELTVSGAYVIDLEPYQDERGFFARCFDSGDMAALGLTTEFPQCNLSRNTRCGTLRGMHYTASPGVETKIVRCVAGAIYDVIVDVRQGPTFGAWTHVELTAQNGRALYIPAGVAHGFLTLADNSDVFYHMGERHRPEVQRGFRWNDDAFGVTWPSAPTVISTRDDSYEDFRRRDAE